MGIEILIIGVIILILISLALFTRSQDIDSSDAHTNLFDSSENIQKLLGVTEEKANYLDSMRKKPNSESISDSDDAPDFDSMSPEELMVWMESLQKKSSKNGE